MSEYIPEEIFCPKSFPKYTYIERRIEKHESYEKRMQTSLRVPGTLVAISGASKSGKTVLCHKVIKRDDMVLLSGSQIKNAEDFWSQIGEWVPLPLETEANQSEQRGKNLGATADISGNILIANGKAGGFVENQTSEVKGTILKRARTNRDLINYLIDNRKVLVLDDFHYIAKEVQLYLARILKAELFNGLKAVITTLPRRANDAIRQNPDLLGRVTFIQVERWTKEELQEIAQKGFALLDVKCTQADIALLAEESLASPQLMQENCLLLAQTLQDFDNGEVSLDLVKEIFARTAINYEEMYTDLSRKLQAGPHQGRTKRRLYRARDGKQYDIYKIIIDAIRIDPPVLQLTILDIEARVKRILAEDEKLPSKLSLIAPIKHLAEILKRTSPQLDALDWHEQTLYILDPFLLFFLRWSEAID